MFFPHVLCAIFGADAETTDFTAVHMWEYCYLTASFGSALISSVYGVVDAAMVGQRYQGPTGTAALAVVTPVWNIIYSLGLLTGIGGSHWNGDDAALSKAAEQGCGVGVKCFPQFNRRQRARLKLVHERE